MPKFNDQQKVSALIDAAKKDPDTCSVFFHGEPDDFDGAVIVIKGREQSALIHKWLLNQGLTTRNPIPTN